MLYAARKLVPGGEFWWTFDKYNRTPPPWRQFCELLVENFGRDEVHYAPQLDRKRGEQMLEEDASMERDNGDDRPIPPSMVGYTKNTSTDELQEEIRPAETFEDEVARCGDAYEKETMIIEPMSHTKMGSMLLHHPLTSY